MEQLELDRHLWGGARPGAGRKRSKDAGVSHRERAPLASRFPVHVTMRLRPGLPSLRRKLAYQTLLLCFRAARERAGRLGPGFRLVHYSVQSNHLHLLVEAVDRLHLTRGIQGLAVRVARGLNRAWDRTGKVFADRYHDRILRTPREVRRALAYVLCNVARHRRRPSARPDSFSSGPWFDGWREGLARAPAAFHPVTTAVTWLLTRGWRRHGAISVATVPGD